MRLGHGLGIEDGARGPGTIGQRIGALAGRDLEREADTFALRSTSWTVREASRLSPCNESCIQETLHVRT
jgi:hypothetical protein